MPTDVAKGTLCLSLRSSLPALGWKTRTCQTNEHHHQKSFTPCQPYLPRSTQIYPGGVSSSLFSTVPRDPPQRPPATPLGVATRPSPLRHGLHQGLQTHRLVLGVAGRPPGDVEKEKRQRAMEVEVFCSLLLAISDSSWEYH